MVERDLELSTRFTLCDMCDVSRRMPPTRTESGCGASVYRRPAREEQKNGVQTFLQQSIGIFVVMSPGKEDL